MQSSADSDESARGALTEDEEGEGEAVAADAEGMIRAALRRSVVRKRR